MLWFWRLLYDVDANIYLCNAVLQMRRAPSSRVEQVKYAHFYSVQISSQHSRNQFNPLLTPSKHSDVVPTSSGRHVHRQRVVIQFLMSGRRPADVNDWPSRRMTLCPTGTLSRRLVARSGTRGGEGVICLPRQARRDEASTGLSLASTGTSEWR